MARRGITNEEMNEATPVTLVPLDEAGDAPDMDLQDSWDQWREDLRKSQSEGILRVFRIPTDARGQPMVNAKHQADLFNCALDAVGYEDVIERLRREFIRPGEKIITARIMGIRRKSDNAPARTLFNQIVTVERGEEVAPKTDSSIAELARIFQDNATQQMEMMRQLFENRTPAADPMELALKLTTAMTGMIAAMNGGGGRTPLKEIMEMAVLMKGNSGANSMKETVETIVAMKGLLGDLSGATPDGDSPAGIINAVSPLAAPIMQALAEYNRNQAEGKRLATERMRVKSLAAPVTSPNPSSKPAENVATENKPSPVPETNEENVMLKIIREQLDTLTQVASENGDPVPLAKAFLEMVPEEYDEQILRFVDSDNCVATLSALHPKVKEHAEWFERLRFAILAEFAVPDENAPGEFKPQHELTPQSRAALEARGRIKPAG